MTEVNERHNSTSGSSDVWVLESWRPGLNPSSTTSQLGDSGQDLSLSVVICKAKESRSFSERTSVRMK